MHKNLARAIVCLFVFSLSSALGAQEIIDITGYIIKTPETYSGLSVEDSTYGVAFPLAFDEFDYILGTELSNAIGEELLLTGEFIDGDFYVINFEYPEQGFLPMGEPEVYELVGVWDYLVLEEYAEYPMYIGIMTFTEDDRWIFEEPSTGEISEGFWYVDEDGFLVTEDEENVTMFFWGYHEEGGFYLEILSYYSGGEEIDITGSPLLILQ